MDVKLYVFFGIAILEAVPTLQKGPAALNAGAAHMTSVIANLPNDYVSK
jgi:hypothetical protein